MDLLGRLATERRVVLCTLSQPRSSVVTLLEDLQLLHDGKIVFSGPVAGARRHFADIGLPCPLKYNPADHFLDVLSNDSRDPERKKNSEERLAKIAAAAAASSRPLFPLKEQSKEQSKALPTSSSVSAATATWFRQHWILLQRACKAESFGVVMFLMTSALVTASITVLIFRKDKKSDGAALRAQASYGLWVAALVANAYQTFVLSALGFCSERSILHAERRWYSLSAYVCAKYIASIPVATAPGVLTATIVYFGGVGGDLEVLWVACAAFAAMALALQSAGRLIGCLEVHPSEMITCAMQVLTLTTLVSGFYFTLDKPTYLRPLSAISPMRWALQAIISKDFGRARYQHCDPAHCFETKAELVGEYAGLPPISLWGAVWRLFGHSLITTVLTWATLEWQHARLAKMATPTKELSLSSRKILPLKILPLRGEPVAWDVRADHVVKARPVQLEPLAPSSRHAVQLEPLAPSYVRAKSSRCVVGVQEQKSGERVALGEGGARKAILRRRAPLTVRFDKITLEVGKKASRRKILTDVSGSLLPGELTAIMGSSGAGKTSLLRVLSGTLRYNKKDKLTGSLSANGNRVDELRSISRLVEQEEPSWSCLKVSEVLLMAATLQGSHQSAEEAAETALAVAELLDLARLYGSYVGDGAGGPVRGLSGGERRRLSVATQLFCNPSLILLDEPTTGLDSYQALSLVEMLHLLASSAGRTVAATIHCPRGAIAELFGQLQLLSLGQVAYSGPSSKCLAFFEGLGYVCQNESSPVDHYIDVLSIDADASRVLEAWKERTSTEPAPQSPVGQLPGKPPPCDAPWLGQFLLLCKRTWLNGVRDPLFLRVDLGLAAVIGLYLILLLNGTSRHDARGLRNVGGLHYFVMATNGARITSAATTTSSKHARLLVREKQDYSQSALLASRLLVDFGRAGASTVLTLVLVLPGLGLASSPLYMLKCLLDYLLFLGVCWSLGLSAIVLGSDTETRVILANWLQLPLLTSAGWFRPLSVMRSATSWLGGASHFRWIMNGLCQLEFHGRRFGCNGDDCTTGDDRLSFLQFGRFSYFDSTLYLFVLYLGWSVVAYFALLAPTRYAIPKDEDEEEDDDDDKPALEP